ncbi:hypothetical protein SCLCIDRAFT_19715 [Scleroderma citrinum Foug A]|uniref:Uncharacterized protein n=1 Tax=Scleroderma citrinum Foug A TaxID=1036808 RepID=A0A0C3ELH2_9AGAM|nr:hypothetical protein SCLCIDRAFT_19715 [Scleroderma citrinum Foug A]
MTTIFPNGAFDIGRVKEEPTVSGCKYLGTHRTAPTVGVDAVTIRHLRDTLALFASVPATAGPESIQIKSFVAARSASIRTARHGFLEFCTAELFGQRGVLAQNSILGCPGTAGPESV